jgi:hypothetical protein
MISNRNVIFIIGAVFLVAAALLYNDWEGRRADEKVRMEYRRMSKRLLQVESATLYRLDAQYPFLKTVTSQNPTGYEKKQLLSKADVSALIPVVSRAVESGKVDTQIRSFVWRYVIKFETNGEGVSEIRFDPSSLVLKASNSVHIVVTEDVGHQLTKDLDKYLEREGVQWRVE